MPAVGGLVVVKFEIVSHCWNYYRMLTYQASSVFLNPPIHDEVILTVYCSLSDDKKTKLRLDQMLGWDWPTNVTLNIEDIPKRKLFRRAIGRQMTAASTEADWVWFADVDMFIGKRFWDGFKLAVESHPESPLLFPNSVLVSSQDEGDEMVIKSLNAATPQLPSCEQFGELRYPRAIGGVQFVAGDALRQHGYVSSTSNYLREKDTFQSCRGDIAHRRHMVSRLEGASWLRVEMPDLYRIRHSERGRQKEGLEL